jgi:hypothetical protein
MDPTVTLVSIRVLVKEIETATRSETERVYDIAADLAELVTALDEWMTRGGFLPVQWRLQR